MFPTQARIVSACAGLPLALRIAAAKAHHRDQALADLANELSAVDRLGALEVEGDSRSVRAVFASAYRTLSPAAAQLFRLLGLHPGVDLVADLETGGIGHQEPGAVDHPHLCC